MPPKRHMSPEEVVEANRLRMRLHRANLSEAEKTREKEKNAEAQKNRRTNMNEDERVLERERHASSQRNRIANMNEDERALERERHAEAENNRRANMSSPQRDQFRVQNRMQVAMSRHRSLTTTTRSAATEYFDENSILQHTIVKN